MSNTFLLGVGAQKAGTTWLSNYLSSHPNAKMGFMKEYHIFDALYMSHYSEIRKKFLQQRILRVLNPHEKPTNQDLKLLNFLGNEGAYFNFFKKQLEKDSCLLTGDITPSYAGLPIEALKVIKEKLTKRQMNVRVVFIMRDPVERCISAMKMNLDKSGKTLEEFSEFNDLYKSPDFAFRTNYQQTIENIEAVFSQEEIAYFFYEDLFNDKNVKKLCKFLDIPFVKPDYDKKINASNSDVVIPEKLKQDIYLHYVEVYEFIRAKFGAEYIQKIWPNQWSQN